MRFLVALTLLLSGCGDSPKDGGAAEDIPVKTDETTTDAEDDVKKNDIKAAAIPHGEIAGTPKAAWYLKDDGDDSDCWDGYRHPNAREAAAMVYSLADALSGVEVLSFTDTYFDGPAIHEKGIYSGGISFDDISLQFTPPGGSIFGARFACVSETVQFLPWYMDDTIRADAIDCAEEYAIPTAEQFYSLINDTEIYRDLIVNQTGYRYFRVSDVGKIDAKKSGEPPTDNPGVAAYQICLAIPEAP